MKWRKFRQAICWWLGGRNQEDCIFEIKTSHPDEVICDDCEHNPYEKKIEPYRTKGTDGLRADVVIVDEMHLLNEMKGKKDDQ